MGEGRVVRDAWPVEAGVTGRRTFFVDQHGDVLTARNAGGRCSGRQKPPRPDAARAARTKGGMRDEPAANGRGHDGQVWIVVG